MTKTKKEHPAKPEHDETLKDNVAEHERQSRRDEAALREQPEDRSETARQTTPAGKGRSK
jgi:hypothetical protein